MQGRKNIKRIDAVRTDRVRKQLRKVQLAKTVGGMRKQDLID